MVVYLCGIFTVFRAY